MAQKTRARGPPRANGATTSPPVSKTTTASPFPGLSDTRMTSVFSHLIGRQVIVTTHKYAPVSGLFHRTETTGGGPDGRPLSYNFVIKYAREVDGKGDRGRLQRLRDARGGVVPEYWISAKDVVMMAAEGVKLDVVPPGGQEKRFGKGKGLMTDGEISAMGGRRAGRKLKKFDDFAGDVRTMSVGGLENSGPKGVKWDQFAANQKKFGVTTSFDEHQYTTRLDRNSENFAEREKRAATLAAEISGKKTQNIHLREERGQAVDGVGEEEMYGQVNKQVPASDKQNDVEPPQKTTLSYAAAVSGSRSTTGPMQAAAKKEEPKAPVSNTNNSSSQKQTLQQGKPGPVVTGAKPKRNKAFAAAGKPSSLARNPVITGRTSPNRGFDSPSLTPTQDSATVSTLNIEAQTPKIGPEDIKNFQNFKAEKLAQGVVENRKVITRDLWKFKDSFDSREARRTSKEKAAGSKKTPGGSPRSTQRQARNIPSPRTAVNKNKEVQQEPVLSNVPKSGKESSSDPKTNQLPAAHAESIDVKGAGMPAQAQSSTEGIRKEGETPSANAEKSAPPASDANSTNGKAEENKNPSQEQKADAENKPKAKPKFKFNPAAKIFTPKSIRITSQPSSNQTSPAQIPQQAPQIPMQPQVMVPPGYGPDYGVIPQYPMPNMPMTMPMPYAAPPVGFAAPPMNMGPRTAGPYQFYNGVNRFGPGSPPPAGMPPYGYTPQAPMSPSSFVPRGVPMNQYGYPPAQSFIPPQRYAQQQGPPQHPHRPPPQQQYYGQPPLYNQGFSQGHGHDRMSNGRGGRGRGRPPYHRTNNHRGHHSPYHQNRHHSGDAPFLQRAQHSQPHAQHGPPHAQHGPPPGQQLHGQPQGQPPRQGHGFSNNSSTNKQPSVPPKGEITPTAPENTESK